MKEIDKADINLFARRIHYLQCVLNFHIDELEYFKTCGSFIAETLICNILHIQKEKAQLYKEIVKIRGF